MPFFFFLFSSVFQHHLPKQRVKAPEMDNTQRFVKAGTDQTTGNIFVPRRCRITWHTDPSKMLEKHNKMSTPRPSNLYTEAEFRRNPGHRPIFHDCKTPQITLVRRTQSTAMYSISVSCSKTVLPSSALPPPPPKKNNNNNKNIHIHKHNVWSNLLLLQPSMTFYLRLGTEIIVIFFIMSRDC